MTEWVGQSPGLGAANAGSGSCHAIDVGAGKSLRQSRSRETWDNAPVQQSRRSHPREPPGTPNFSLWPVDVPISARRSFALFRGPPKAADFQVSVGVHDVLSRLAGAEIQREQTHAVASRFTLLAELAKDCEFVESGKREGQDLKLAWLALAHYIGEDGWGGHGRMGVDKKLQQMNTPRRGFTYLAELAKSWEFGKIVRQPDRKIRACQPLTARRADALVQETCPTPPDDAGLSSAVPRAPSAEPDSALRQSQPDAPRR
ncbi:uncharacterized protein BDZ83DRAFT_656290 [Colletotrichum acutatum]|uniref:Uncharacterized protein n=1 Tax=Glomerella acutata TaxID=27357 RepID=A0AAD8UBH5_GLOAC|nr:uncharacterized protein BDZ83DRAFT_656290 [Colletotrichum acutatum]KAK1713387.1 hypothetical protein BDZ83DRAFT_656290 [Colletotrichum acutatum]